MPLTPHQIRRVAVRAGVDPRTVDRYLASFGGPPEERKHASTTVARIDAALTAEGFDLRGAPR